MNLNEILSRALEHLTPSSEERMQIELSVNNLLEKLKNCIKRLNLNLNIEIEGSIAKDTWLSKEPDVDVFILFPENLDKISIKRILISLARCLVGENYVEAYAEHPYLEINYGNFKMDLVPCIQLSSINEAKTAVDRTPFHTRYIKANLKESLKDDVRLLKGFMKGIDCYGAETRIKGFSGYLCELLILYYGSFVNVLKNSINWKPFHTVIDIEEHYKNPDEAIKLFNSPLIVIDPIDKNRNVAAALSIESMSKFMAASKLFIDSPSLDFFFPKITKPLLETELIYEIKRRSSDLIFIITNCPKIHSEILWGQLYKSLEGLKKFILNYDFEIINCSVWSDEKDIIIFLFELESSLLSNIKKHIGPPVYIHDEAKSFLNKYLNSQETLSGPKIEGYRWIVYLKRKYTSINQLLSDKIFTAKLGNIIKSSLKHNYKILRNEEILELYSSNMNFALFLSNYLKGSYTWIINQSK